eukprot:UN08423
MVTCFLIFNILYCWVASYVFFVSIFNIHVDNISNTCFWYDIHTSYRTGFRKYANIKKVKLAIVLVLI